MWGWILLILLTLALLGPAAYALVQNFRQNRRRRQVLQAPFPPAWDQLLDRKLAVYRRLPPDLKQRLHQCTKVLAAEKRFEACGGIPEVTEEMRVLVAAQASMLLIGHENHEYYPDLYSILIYPSSYYDSGRRTFALPEAPDSRLGESWSSGSVVLAWDSVVRGAAEADDGVNVVYHEFAHQLDQSGGEADGVPELESMEDYADWSGVFRERYTELVREARRSSRLNPLLDDYGATNPAEFFAVATEAFFERARRLKREMPDLYEELSEFYGLDPAEWRSSSEPAKRGQEG